MMKTQQQPTIKGSYEENDVTFVLKDISNSVKEQSTKEREVAIQQGTHYSEMLPIEYQPSSDYIKIYEQSLEQDAKKLAQLLALLAEKIRLLKNENITLVSLARAGTPIGVLLYRYYKEVYKEEISHYSISIIRGKGIDENALNYILDKHDDQTLVFIDGWTGKGAITKVLQEAISDFNTKYNRNIDSKLAVLADPGFCADISSTHDDFLIPSACLNSTVSGLVSRTFHRADIIGENDFHGARYYKHLSDGDCSLAFINIIQQYYSEVSAQAKLTAADDTLINVPTWKGLHSVNSIKEVFGIEDINLIKPGIGETTRVLLRRDPWKILIHPEKTHLLTHVLQLAKEKGIATEEYSDMSYSCCGLIKNVAK